MRALVIHLNDKPVGILGIAKDAEVDVAFTEYKPALEPYLKSITVLRAGMQLLKWCRASRIPVLAHSGGLLNLERVGFARLSGDVYQCLT